MQHADTTHCGHSRDKGSVLEPVVSSNHTEPLSNELSKAIGLKCTNVLYHIGRVYDWRRVAWSSLVLTQSEEFGTFKSLAV